MNFFPQIQSGALVQYPFSQRIVHRTAVDAHADGSAIKLADPDWTHTIWQLAYTGCTRTEMAALEALFRAVEGRLGSFVFPDPWDNLLVWSENPAHGAWSKGSQVECAGWASDPFGGTAATIITNHGAGWQGVSQTLAAPPGYVQCFSLYARAGQSGEIVLFRRAGAERVERRERIRTAWQRFQQATAHATDGEATEFGVEVETGRSATVFGFQVEPQTKAGLYRRTTEDGGIYREAHFDQDELEIVAEGPGRWGTTVRVRARREAG